MYGVREYLPDDGSEGTDTVCVGYVAYGMIR